MKNLLLYIFALITIIGTISIKADWSYKRPINVTNSTASTLTDCQVLITISTTIMGNPYSNVNVDGSDIRFSTGDGLEPLSYWVESWDNTGESKIWVKIPSIPVGTTTPINMYYGNPLATSASDPNSTFIFFDHFDNSNLGTDWIFSQIGSSVGSVSESGSVLRITGTNTGDLWNNSDNFLFLSIFGNYDNIVIESYTSTWGGGHTTWSKMGGVQLRQSLDANSKNRIMSPVYTSTGATNSYRLALGGPTAEDIVPIQAKYNKISRSGANSKAWYSTDGNSWTELGSEISFTDGLLSSVYLGISLAGLSATSHWVEVDWFRIRKYISIEPSNTIGDYISGSYSLGSPLPVELTTFIAHVNENAISLIWQTATEVNNYGFDVERKSGMSNWMKLDFVQGHGNSNSPKNYTYTDNTILVPGKYFYRLKQIDIDGTFEYSDKIEINLDSPKSFELKQNYPNPFNPTTSISYSIPNDNYVKLSIIDALGAEVAVLENGYKVAGSYSNTFDANKLASGIYFYRLQAWPAKNGIDPANGGASNFVETKRMILLR